MRILVQQLLIWLAPIRTLLMSQSLQISEKCAANLHDLYANRKLSTSTLVIICSESSRF